jgi:curved DNA-binding protein
MSVQFKDYYEILGVGRGASADEIKKTYRKLARRHHPDRNPGDKNAEERFKEINEAHEVLRDPERRRRYDQLGTAGFHPGQAINPEDLFNLFGGAFGRTEPGDVRFETFTTGPGGGRRGSFSDFFEALFGGMGGLNATGDPFTAGGSAHERWGTTADFFDRASAQSGAAGKGQQDVVTSLTISLEEAYRGATRRLSFRRTDNRGSATEQDYEVKIPPGIRPGQKIRLKGQGHAARGRSGDILIAIDIAPHPHFHLEGENLVRDLLLAPWEAALGQKVVVSTLDGEVEIRVPPGLQAGKKLRVRGQGWPRRDGAKGDLYLQVRILNPPNLTNQERELMERLAKVSRFNPRA